VKRSDRVADSDQASRRERFGAFVRARKWLVGLVLGGIAAAVTGIIASGITSGVHRVTRQFEKTPAPVSVTRDRFFKIQRPHNLETAHYVFTRPISAIPFPTKGDLRYIAAWDAWAYQNGGLDADRTVVQVIVEGNTARPVILTGLTVDITRRVPPPKGTFVAAFGGAPFFIRHFAVDLDARPPTVTSVAAAPEVGGKPAIEFPHTVSQAKPEALHIAAFTMKCDCSWKARLHWIYRGKSGTTVIDDNGRPFRTVSGSRSTKYFASDGHFVKSA
jgi:hypothetical protein